MENQKGARWNTKIYAGGSLPRLTHSGKGLIEAASSAEMKRTFMGRSGQGEGSSLLVRQPAFEDRAS